MTDRTSDLAYAAEKLAEAGWADTRPYTAEEAIVSDVRIVAEALEERGWGPLDGWKAVARAQGQVTQREQKRAEAAEARVAQLEAALRDARAQIQNYAPPNGPREAMTAFIDAALAGEKEGSG